MVESKAGAILSPAFFDPSLMIGFGFFFVSESNWYLCPLIDNEKTR